jgi:hypothetical protein
MKKLLLFLLIISHVFAESPAVNPTPPATTIPSASIINGGFETGDLTGWTFTGETENSFNSRVEGGSFSGATTHANNFGFFTPAPMEGNYSFFSGFDGLVQEITLSQDIGIIDEYTTAVSFDVRAGWDLQTYANQSGYEVIEDRTIKVVITDNNTQETLLSQDLFNAIGNTKVLDSGFQNVGINFQNIVGSDVTMSFVQNIPQAYTGPALIQLDNIKLQQTYVPEPNLIALIFGWVAMLFVVFNRRH